MKAGTRVLESIYNQVVNSASLYVYILLNDTNACILKQLFEEKWARKKIGKPFFGIPKFHNFLKKSKTNMLIRTNWCKPAHTTAMSRSAKFDETLEKAISFLLDYKPDYVHPVTNISNLCKLLYLDFFQDTIQDSTTEDDNSIYQRLSIAGKILVLDIDYKTDVETKQDCITNVMLVLASNFDQFNYKNHLNENIFLNNLTREQTLSKFYHNVKIMKNMDDCTDMDKGSTDFFQYYNNTVKDLFDYFATKLNINADHISINKNDELNMVLSIGNVDVLRIIPVFKNATADSVKLLEYNSGTWEERDTKATKFLCFKVHFPIDIQFNERMSSLLGPDNFQNNKSLNFYDLKVDGLTLNAELMNKNFEMLWKWVYWYTVILEKSTSLTDDGESIMKNGQLLKFENEIGTWTF